MSLGEHYSVLLQESVEGLISNPDGFYVDGTFGRGGHSREILNKLSSKARLLAFDKDPKAIVAAESLLQDSRFSIEHDSFSKLSSVMEKSFEYQKLDGVLLDLGVSSPQLDEAGRGFSFMHDGPLDMRMNNSEGISAQQWVAETDEADMVWTFREYGEEKFSKRIARAIINVRAEREITRTADLAQIIKDANPRWEKHKHPATRVFQAIRIAVNRELDDLKKALEQAVDLLLPGGRIVVISFHSLEDRIVKRFFRDMSKGKELPKHLPVTEAMLDKKLKLLGKAIKPGEKEIDENIRSRSAVMRIAERLA